MAKFVHVTSRGNLEGIARNGITPNEDLIGFRAKIAQVLGASSVYVGQEQSYGLARINYIREDAVALPVDTDGLSLLADIPGLQDFGAFISDRTAGGALLLESPLARDLFHDLADHGVIGRDQFMDPDSEFTRRAINITGTASILGAIERERIEIPDRSDLIIPNDDGYQERAIDRLLEVDFSREELFDQFCERPWDRYSFITGDMAQFISFREAAELVRGDDQDLILTLANVNQISMESAEQMVADLRLILAKDGYTSGDYLEGVERADQYRAIATNALWSEDDPVVRKALADLVLEPEWTSAEVLGSLDDHPIFQAEITPQQRAAAQLRDLEQNPRSHDASRELEL